MTQPLRIGTRASSLAMVQSGRVAADLTERLGRPVVLVNVRTVGDESSSSLRTIGGTGVFVSALREALASGQVDVAVHSLKDLPTANEPGIVLAAVPPREDPRDALVARDGLHLHELPPGSRVGTGSPRRAAALAGLGLDIVDIRGNVDTRLSRVGDDLDAVVVALAGLRRLGRDGEATELLDPLLVLPAPGQGALAVETRADDPLTDAVRIALDDIETRWAVSAERAVLATLEAGCSAPVGALADVGMAETAAAGALEIYLRASLGVARDPDDGGGWSGLTRASRTAVVADVEAAHDLGVEVARRLAPDGMSILIPPAPIPAQTVGRR